ncbi:MinD/ParA family protein [Halomarina salina]|uniref:MinD/ParA family protein n=1 Tax=Halomarina salina TaxID=1872699 RepID=A0ABD5RRJ2_9EURY|nr:P-loop NTPase [Halomarina salina]
MLAVTGGKGGVGKTTTALGVARALGRRGEEVLVVDTDRDLPDLARTAGVDTVRSDVTDPDATASRQDPHSTSVRILTAPRDRTEARRLVEGVAGRRERVVLDCPAGSGRPAAVPLRAADRSVVVSTADPASLRDASKTVALARTLGAPPTATVLSGCDEPPHAVERLLPTPVVAVPDACDPLDAVGVTSRHTELSEIVTLRNC